MLSTESQIARNEWLAQVAERTSARRIQRAEAHEDIESDCAAQAARLVDLPPCNLLRCSCMSCEAVGVARFAGHRGIFEHRSALLSRARWHRRRARGERERLARVLACKTTHYTLRCPGCFQADETQRPIRCEAWRYCVSCRGSRCRDYRERIDQAMQQARTQYQRELSCPNARWSEKMLTVTVPHSGDVQRDLETLHATWRRFWRELRKWFRAGDSRARRPLPFVRIFEVTRSDGGHAHCHVWMLTPYVPAHVLRVLWGTALRGATHCPVVSVHEARELVLAGLVGPVCAARCTHKSCGRLTRLRRLALRELVELASYRNKPLAFLPWPVLDVRAAYGEHGAELVKYLTKDIGASGELLDCGEYAAIIESTEGRRLVTAAIRFWVAVQPFACQCGCAIAPLREPVERSRSLPAGGPRGPPALSFIPRGTTVRTFEPKSWLETLRSSGPLVSTPPRALPVLAFVQPSPLEPGKQWWHE